jgi:phenylpropionate dioxygenase-like ring-hydroxylating dioxygenase large terminal subunit
MKIGSSLFVPAAHYTSPEFAKLEAERLWPRVWQMVCRQEHLPTVGSYVTYDIVDQSFIVTRTDEHTIRAFYNSCLHRGRRLLSGSGAASRIRCPYHAWTYGMDGSLQSMLCPEDYSCGNSPGAEMHLKEVRAATWGGFVFINPDPAAEPLEEFLNPVPQIIGCFDWESMRYAWYFTIKLKCNWKTAIEAFLESYHPPATHSQLNGVIDTTQAVSFVNGKHGHTGYPNGRSFGWSALEGDPTPPTDIRAGWVKAMELLHKQSGNVCRRDAEACRRLLTEVAPNASHAEVAAKAMQFMQEATEAAGAKWPSMSPDQVRAMGNHWNISPNVSFVPGARGASLVFRARPDGCNPDSCMFDFGVLERFAPGTEPRFDPEVLDDWRAHIERFPVVLTQDFAMVEEVQRGMKSRAWSGAQLNRVKEKQIANMHAVIESYVGEGAAAG